MAQVRLRPLPVLLPARRDSPQCCRRLADTGAAPPPRSRRRRSSCRMPAMSTPAARRIRLRST